MPIDLNEHLKKKSNSSNNGNGGGGGGGNIEPPLKTPEFMKNFGKKAGLLYAVIIIVALFVIAKPFVVINSGEVGIQVTAGKFDTVPLEPGFHFFIPILQKVIVVDTKIRIINYKGKENLSSLNREGITTNEPITVLDSRGLPVSIELTVQYRLKSLNAPQTIAEWGLNWEDKIVNPVVRDVVRNIVGRFTAEELPTKRNEIASLIDTEIRTTIDKLPNQPVELTSIQLREIVLPEKIKDQIERVQIARQEAERTKYEVERAKQEAQKKAALASGEAEAKRINAQGMADAIEIEANANAKANKLISNSLTGELLKLKQIEVQGKFNEALSVNKDAKIFLTPGGSTPNIWVDTKDSQKTTSANR